MSVAVAPAGADLLAASTRTGWEARARQVAVAAGGTTVLASLAWIALAAAARPGPLSPPTLRLPPAEVPAWLLGPLHGIASGVASAPEALHADQTRVWVLVGLGWLACWAGARAVRLRWLLGLVVAAHAVLLLAPPLALTDVFNYAPYGRMGPLAGANPYRVPPAAAPHDLVWTLANWHGLRSPYGPLFTLVAQAGARLPTPAWLWVWKGIVVAASLGTVGLVCALARRTGADPRRAVAVLGLSPLLLLGEVGGLHNDGPCVLAVVAAAWCLVRSREGEGAPAWASPAAGALAVAAAGLKPSFAIVVPLVLLGAGSRPRAVLGAAGAGAAVLAVVGLAFGGALPNVSEQSALVTPLSLPNLLGLAAGHGGADASARRAGQAVLALGVLAACVVVARRRDLTLDALGAVLLLALLTLAWTMPWYLVWSLPFLALGRPRRLGWLLVPLTAWLTLGAVPQLEDLMHLVGYFPTRLATGRANHLAFEALVK